MRLSIAKWYPAHSSNQTRGRGGNAVDRITIHHTAALNSTLRHLWGDPARNGSSHFFVGNSSGLIEQYVDTDNTAWTNGNFASNQRAITIEVTGDWRFGYKNATALKNLEKLLVELRKRFPTARLTYHMDESSKVTLCPAGLKHNGYAKQAWDAAGKALEPTKPTPSKVTYKRIDPKKVMLTRDANLWDFDFSKWADARSKGSYPKGHVVDVVAEATNTLGATYYMTEYSYDKGNIRATNGFNTADVKDYKAPEPVPTPKPEPEPRPDPVPKPQPEPPVPPQEPPASEGDEYPAWFVGFWAKLVAAINNIIGRK